MKSGFIAVMGIFALALIAGCKQSPGTSVMANEASVDLATDRGGKKDCEDLIGAWTRGNRAISIAGDGNDLTIHVDGQRIAGQCDDGMFRAADGSLTFNHDPGTDRLAHGGQMYERGEPGD